MQCSYLKAMAYKYIKVNIFMHNLFINDKLWQFSINYISFYAQDNAGAALGPTFKELNTISPFAKLGLTCSHTVRVRSEYIPMLLEKQNGIYLKSFLGNFSQVLLHKPHLSFVYNCTSYPKIFHCLLQTAKCTLLRCALAQKYPCRNYTFIIFNVQ